MRHFAQSWPATDKKLRALARLELEVQVNNDAGRIGRQETGRLAAGRLAGWLAGRPYQTKIRQ